MKGKRKQIDACIASASVDKGGELQGAPKAGLKPAA